MNRNLEYYKNLNYKIHLTVNKNIYYFSIPELFCFSQDKNIDVAYNNLLSLKEEFINNMDRSQNLDFINEPHSYRQYNFFKKLFPFFIKLLIISLISLAIIEISIISFGRVFYPKVEQINSTLDELKFILNNTWSNRWTI